MGALKDLSGQRFGRLLVIGRSADDPRKRVVWDCVCDCGRGHSAVGCQLTAGRTTSCGCYQRESAAEKATKHGMAGTSEHNIWWAMICRCENRNSHEYDRYGGRGIGVCTWWRYGDGRRSGFECFYSDMGPRPSKRHSIERKNNSGDYEPNNCVWATLEEQARNKRDTVLIPFGLGLVPLRTVCEALELPFKTIRWRLRQGWPVDRALSENIRTAIGVERT